MTISVVNSLLTSLAAFYLVGALPKDAPPADLEARAGKTKYVAIGDSFPAGVGAGWTLGPPWKIGDCRRTDGSYPWQFKQRLKYSDDEFSFHACNGQDTATADAVQIKGFGTEDVSLISVQVGGNSVGFADILRGCVYAINPDCDNLITATHNKINSDPFKSDMDHLLDDLTKTAKPDALIVFMGYARFFNVDADSTLTPNVCRTPKDVRQRINDLVGDLNNAISSMTARHGVVFIDPDGPNSLWNGHRFCDGQFEWTQMYFQYVPTWQDLEKGLFHPSVAGHTAYSDLLAIAASHTVA